MPGIFTECLLMHMQEELQRHFVWLANKKYIEQHNANAQEFGYTLGINQYGDLVSSPSSVVCHTVWV